jgi:hypothetical protein
MNAEIIRTDPVLFADRPAKRRRALAVLGLALAASVAVPAARAQTAENGPPPACVRTPAEYAKAFENCEPIQCLNANLYGVIGKGPPADQRDVYPPEYHWAWVAGFESLLKYSDWRVQACRRKITDTEVTRRILLFVGFGQSSITPRTPYTLSVMDLGTDSSLFVPTWEAWFQAFQSVFGVRIPLETQKLLTLGVTSPGQSSDLIDPTRVFANITGCPASSVAQCDDPPLSACRPSYEATATVLMRHSPIVDKGSTAECAKEFRSYLAGKSADVAEARALLRYCQDVNPCNTGRGLGFNPAWGSANGATLSHFTGREFVLHNQSLDSLGASRIGLAEVPPRHQSNPTK